ncbi:hypothetical protein Tco_0206249 [Tanacetum coccineum]
MLNTDNNDKNLCEIQLDHERVDRLVVVVVKGDGERDLGWTCGGNEGDSFWKVDDDFGVDVFRFQTCLIIILGFLEKLEWWFEQDIDDEGEEVEEDEDGGEV